VFSGYKLQFITSRLPNINAHRLHPKISVGTHQRCL